MDFTAPPSVTSEKKNYPMMSSTFPLCLSVLSRTSWDDEPGTDWQSDYFFQKKWHSTSTSGAFAKLRKLTIKFFMSFRLSAWNNSAPIGRIFTKYDIWAFFFENLLKILKFHQNLTRLIGTLHKDQYTYLIESRLILLRMKTFSSKSCRENQNTHFVFDDCFSKMLPFMRKCVKT
jgi:hypothetical protein